MTPKRISRRKLLAGMAGGSVASLAWLAITAGGGRGSIDPDDAQTVVTDTLRLTWWETYNGATLTTPTASTDGGSAAGPAISLGNVLPGDFGTLTVRLRLDSETADELAVKPVLTVSLIGEPGSSGLEEFLEATVWYDTGVLGIDAFGAHNGERNFGERLVHPDAAGTLADVVAALEGGVVLDAAPVIPATSCLDTGDDVTITVGWSFPPEQEHVNAAQGTSVEFDLRFDVEQC